MVQAKKSRWKRVLLWCSISLVVLVGAGLFAINYAIDRVLESMVDMDALEAAAFAPAPESSAKEEGQDGVTDMKAPTEEGATPPADSGSSSAEPEADDPPADTADSGSSDTAGAGGDKPEPAAEPAKPTEPKKSIEPQDEAEVDLTYTPEVTVEKAVAVREKVTVSEKAKVTTLLAKQLSVSDLEALTSMASGGLSVDEKREARRILLEKMSPEEYNELSSIAKKYGLSQGRTYEDVSKEEEQRSAEE